MQTRALLTAIFIFGLSFNLRAAEPDFRSLG